MLFSFFHTLSPPEENLKSYTAGENLFTPIRLYIRSAQKLQDRIKLYQRVFKLTPLERN